MTIEYAEICRQYRKDKKYIDMTVIFNPDRKLIPIAFGWASQYYKVIRILNIVPMAVIRPGGVGCRYSCMVTGKQFYLYFDGVRWYIKTSEY